MRGTPGSAYPQPEPNATELPSSAPGRPKLIKLHASAPSPTPTRAEEHIATTPDCRLRALARRRAPKRTSHYTCWCERNTLRETLGALATWVPATAMLPLPLALSLSLTSSWQQHNFSLSAPRRSAGTAAAARSCSTISHCPRRDEAPVPPLLPALVALWSAAIATMCRRDDALGLPWYRSTRSCVEPTKR